MIHNLKSLIQIKDKLVYILSDNQKRSAIFLVLVIVVRVFFELLGVTAVYPFLQALLTPYVVMENKYLRPFIQLFHIETSRGVLVLIGIVLILIYIFKNIYMIFSYYVQYNYSTKVQKELSIKILNSYMSRPYSFFLNINSSEILRACGGDVNGVFMILSCAFDIVAEGLSIVVIGIFIFETDIFMAVSVLLLMALVGGAIILAYKPVMKRLGRKEMAAQVVKSKAIYQTVTGVKELYVMQRKQLFLDEYSRAADDVRRVTRNKDFLAASPERIIEGVCVSGLIGVVVIRLLMGVDVMNFVPQLGMFAMAAFKILPSVGKVSNRVTMVVYHNPMLDNVYNVIVGANEYEKVQTQYQDMHGGRENDEIDCQFHDNVSIQNITWKYAENKDNVLYDLQLDIKKGESIALIGPSGAGKTTLADIILGLLQPQSGSVYMDGRDVYAMPKQWAKIIGYVPQSVFLMDDTVRANVAFGLMDVDDKRIWDALQDAQIKEFVESLPYGLDTIVGERGVKFSGGQRQRIAIARALYNNPQILVLDEATSALDNETENAVMEAVEALQGKMTLIIVAHRLTTIRNCDKIYEIKDGKAIERDKEEVMVGGESLLSRKV